MFPKPAPKRSYQRLGTGSDSQLDLETDPPDYPPW